MENEMTEVADLTQYDHGQSISEKCTLAAKHACKLLKQVWKQIEIVYVNTSIN